MSSVFLQIFWPNYTDCHSVYVGQTSRKLHERFREHKKDIEHRRDKPVAEHFNHNCPSMDYLQITPLEHVPITQPETITMQDGSVRDLGMGSRRDNIALLNCEQKWIKKLKSMQPHGINSRKDLLSPIPFCLKFMDQSPNINKIIKQYIHTYQYNNKTNVQVVCASKRNPNLKDLLVRA